MDSWNLPSFSFPRFVESVGCGSGRGEESSGGGILRLIRIRLATPSLQKKPRSCQANSPQAQIADSISAKRSQFLIFSLNRPRQIARSNSRNAVNFSSACTTKRFPSSRCASATKIVRPSSSTAAMHRQLTSMLNLRNYGQVKVIAIAAFVTHLVSVAVGAEDRAVWKVAERAGDRGG